MQLTKSIIAVGMLAVAAPAFVDCSNGVCVIDLDDLGDQGNGLHFAPSNHYAGCGVIFSRNIPFGNVSSAGWPSNFWASVGGTPPNFMQLYLPAAGLQID